SAPLSRNQFAFRIASIFRQKHSASLRFSSKKRTVRTCGFRPQTVWRMTTLKEICETGALLHSVCWIAIVPARASYCLVRMTRRATVVYIQLCIGKEQKKVVRNVLMINSLSDSDGTIRDTFGKVHPSVMNGVYRPNLNYEVERVSNDGEKQ